MRGPVEAENRPDASASSTPAARALADVEPCPREIGVVARVVRVVGGDRRAHPSHLEQLVPVHRREAATDLELAPGVVDLDPDDALRKLEARGHAGPVRMCEVGDAAARDDPLRRLREVGVLLRERPQLVLVRRDAVTENVAVAGAGEDAVQLDAREDEDPVDCVRVGDPPVVRDRQYVVAGPGVVAGEVAGAELSVRARRVRVQSGLEPGPAGRPDVAHRHLFTTSSPSVWPQTLIGSSLPTSGGVRGGLPGAGVRVLAPSRRGAARSAQAPQTRSRSRRGPDDLLTVRRRSRHASARSGRSAGARQIDAAQESHRGREEGEPPEHDRAAAQLGELRRDHEHVHEEVRDRHYERQSQRARRRRRTRPSGR